MFNCVRVRGVFNVYGWVCLRAGFVCKIKPHGECCCCCVCACVCVCGCVCYSMCMIACARACVCVCGCVCYSMCMIACARVLQFRCLHFLWVSNCLHCSFICLHCSFLGCALSSLRVGDLVTSTCSCSFIPPPNAHRCTIFSGLFGAHIYIFRSTYIFQSTYSRGFSRAFSGHMVQRTSLHHILGAFRSTYLDPNPDLSWLKLAHLLAFVQRTIFPVPIILLVKADTLVGIGAVHHFSCTH